MSNYTEAMVERLESQPEWTYAQAVEFADEHGLKVRSVIAKIISLQLGYVPKPKVTKTGEPVVRKESYVESIQNDLGEQFPSMVKMTKADLSRLAVTIALRSVA